MKNDIQAAFQNADKFKATINKPFKKIMGLYTQLNIADEQISIDKSAEQPITSAYKDKMAYFIIETRGRLKSMLLQFFTISVVYLALGVYFIIGSNKFYDKMSFAFNICKTSASRLPYMTLMISAMRSEMFIIDQLMNDDGENIYNVAYENFRLNEMAFLKYKDSFVKYYRTEKDIANQFANSSACQFLLSDQNLKKSIIVNRLHRCIQWTNEVWN